MGTNCNWVLIKVAIPNCKPAVCWCAFSFSRKWITMNAHDLRHASLSVMCEILQSKLNAGNLQRYNELEPESI